MYVFVKNSTHINNNNKRTLACIYTHRILKWREKKVIETGKEWVNEWKYSLDEVN